jgi:catechol 2,3-dioxygenase-like lactoylglutathione lyase family enzyme
MTLSLHHAHLLATDIEATIEFWTRAFDATVVYDENFADARNVFLTVGGGRLHLYDQPPKVVGQGTVHHLGVQADDLEEVVDRLRAMDVSVTDIRHEPTADYAMAMGPDELLIEIFRPNPAGVPNHLRGYFNLPDTHRDDKDPA